MGSVLSRSLREPLLHFVLIGAALFGLYVWVNPEAAYDEATIVVTEERMDLLKDRFERTWNRAPSAQEVDHMVDSFIIEEIFYRQALAMGLDDNDAIIRRRLRQKMEALVMETAELLEPSDQELQAYLEENAAVFQGDPQISFEQIYISTDAPAEQVARRVAHVQQRLAAGLPVEEVTGSMLPRHFTAVQGFAVDRRFGQGFAARLAALPVGQWSAPLASGLGLHLVRVSDYQPASMPALAEVRSQVKREWQNARRQTLETVVLDNLKANYTIIVEDRSGSTHAG